ncbi:hypothetical protein N7451_001915 [Penicillium sp. IBT 35674x]|nr:hypothetical protein N7451_001915 [Penicillium sp. IBT 35674x]
MVSPFNVRSGLSMRSASIRHLLPRVIHCRAYSSLPERLHHDLTTRKLPLTFDYLHPQPSHLLNLSLHDLLPQSSGGCNVSPILPSITNPSPLPIGHHLIYFPPQVTLSQLVPDGCDVLHTPGDPFNRRMWAGGNVRFPTAGPLLDGSRAVCIESIRNVTVKGREGDEKVIVTIERRVGTVPEGEAEEETWNRIWQKNEVDLGSSSLIENRDLIFMRAKTAEQIALDREQFSKPTRFVKSPSGAVFRHSILPTKALLFRFSALTMNAHLIHLDKEYTQNQEGFRTLLVHGPLTLTLLLSVLQNHLRSLNLRVGHIEYRNLAPLYVEEELTICGKPKNDGAWDVWIEGPRGSLAVRGIAKSSPA